MIRYRNEVVKLPIFDTAVLFNTYSLHIDVFKKDVQSVTKLFWTVASQPTSNTIFRELLR